MRLFLLIPLLLFGSIEVRVEREENNIYKLGFTNLVPERTYKIAFLREDKSEYLSYPLVQKSDGSFFSKATKNPQLVELIDFDNYRGIVIAIEDTTSGEKKHFSYYPEKQKINLDGIEISLVCLDPRGRNLLCQMSGFDPYEPFLCQTAMHESNTIEGTANADGTFNYLITHATFDKGGKDPFALFRNKTSKVAITEYTWGKPLVRGKKNRIKKLN